MAQGKAETDAPIEDMLLQQHLAFLTRFTFITISNRILYIVVIGALILFWDLAWTRLLALGCVAALITVVWFAERRLINQRISTIERIIAQQSGGPWEDAYIKLRGYYRERHFDEYEDYASYLTRLWRLWRYSSLRFEPYLWFLIAVLLIFLQAYL